MNGNRKVFIIWLERREKKVELDGEKCCNKVFFIYGIRQWLLLTD